MCHEFVYFEETSDFNCSEASSEGSRAERALRFPRARLAAWQPMEPMEQPIEQPRARTHPVSVGGTRLTVVWILPNAATPRRGASA